MGRGRGGVRKVGKLWEGERRGTEGRRVVERRGEGCGGVAEWWEGEGRVWKVREWEGEGRGVEDRRVVGRGRGAVRKVGE